MRFSVYFDCILNKKCFFFHTEIMISAADMLPCKNFFLKMCNLMRYCDTELLFYYTIVVSLQYFDSTYPAVSIIVDAVRS